MIFSKSRARKLIRNFAWFCKFLNHKFDFNWLPAVYFEIIFLQQISSKYLIIITKPTRKIWVMASHLPAYSSIHLKGRKLNIFQTNQIKFFQANPIKIYFQPDNFLHLHLIRTNPNYWNTWMESFDIILVTRPLPSLYARVLIIHGFVPDILSLCLVFVYVSVAGSQSRYLCQFNYLFNFIFIYLCSSLCISLSLCLVCVCVSVCLSVYVFLCVCQCVSLCVSLDVGWWKTGVHDSNLILFHNNTYAARKAYLFIQ